MTEQFGEQEFVRPVQKVILITNPGDGIGSELALTLAAHWHRQGTMHLAAVVANQAPVGTRAALAKATLEKLGAADVPVYAGSNAMHLASAEEKMELENIPYVKGLKLPPALPAIRALIAEEHKNYTRNLAIVNLAALTDLALFAAAEKRVFPYHVSRVTLMGGYAHEVEAGTYLTPDSSKNNAYDPDAAENAYRMLFERAVPVRLVTPDLGNHCKVSRSFKAKLSQIGCPIAMRFAEALKNPENESCLWNAVTLAMSVVPDLPEPITSIHYTENDTELCLDFLESQILEALTE